MSVTSARLIAGRFAVLDDEWCAQRIVGRLLRGVPVQARALGITGHLDRALSALFDDPTLNDRLQDAQLQCAIAQQHRVKCAHVEFRSKFAFGQ